MQPKRGHTHETCKFSLYFSLLYAFWFSACIDLAPRIPISFIPRRPTKSKKTMASISVGIIPDFASWSKLKGEFPQWNDVQRFTSTYGSTTVPNLASNALWLGLYHRLSFLLKSLVSRLTWGVCKHHTPISSMAFNEFLLRPNCNAFIIITKVTERNHT